MAKQKYTEAKKNSNLRWDTANLDRMSLALPKGSRETIKAHAAGQGESTNAFIKRAIDCQMERDGAGEPQEAVGTSTRDGAIFLPQKALEVAQVAADRTGEAVAEFIARAIDTQAQRDKGALQMGINPATREKLQYRKEGGTDHE